MGRASAKQRRDGGEDGGEGGPSGGGDVVWLDLVRFRRELGSGGGPMGAHEAARPATPGGESAALRVAFCAAVASAPTRPATLAELLLGRRLVPDTLATMAPAAPGWAASPDPAERSPGERAARDRARRRMGEAAWEDLSWLLDEVVELQTAGRPGPALRAANRAVDAGADDPEVYLVRGDLRLRVGVWEAARRDAERALALAPAAPRGHLIRAESFDLAGGRAPAKAALERGRRLAPDSLRLRVAEAELALRAGAPVRACELWDELLDRQPCVHFRLGRSLARQICGDLEGAVSDAEAAIAAAPDDGCAWSRRAALHEAACEHDAARDAWSRAFEADAGRPEIYLERACARRADHPLESLVDALAARTLAAGEPRVRGDAQRLLRLLRRPCRRAADGDYRLARHRLWEHLTRLIEWMAWRSARDLLTHAAVVDPRLDLRLSVVKLLSAPRF